MHDRFRLLVPKAVAVSVLILMLASCGGSDTAADPTTAVPSTSTEVTTTEAPTTTMAPTPTTTMAPPTTTTMAPPTTTIDFNAPFRDDFEGGLDASWVWLNEDPARWAIDGGALVLTADNPGLASDSQDLPEVNILIRPIPMDVDIAATVHLTVDPDENFEQAGIVLFADGDSYVNLAAGFCGPCGVGRAIFLETPNDGGSALEGLNAVPIPPGTTEMRLRLEHSPESSATVALVAFGADGDWQQVGEIIRDMPVFETVALGAANQPGPESTDAEDLVARFEWFEIEVYG